MTSLAVPSAPAPTADADSDADLSVWQWLRQTPRAWRHPTWHRRVAAWAIVGVIGDALTTSALPHVPGIYEANPLTAAGQQLLGSVPVFMAVISVPLIVILAGLANRPRNRALWFVWSCMAFAGATKLAVTVWNLHVLTTVLSAQTILVV